MNPKPSGRARDPEDNGGGAEPKRRCPPRAPAHKLSRLPSNCAQFSAEMIYVMTTGVTPGKIASMREVAKSLYAGALAAWPTHVPGGFQLALYLVRALTTSRSERQAGRRVWTREMIGAFPRVNGNGTLSLTTEFLSKTVLAVEAALLVLDSYYDAMCLTAQRILKLEIHQGPIFWLLFCAVAGWVRTERGLSFTTEALDVFNRINKPKVICRGATYYNIAGTGWVQRSMETPDAARQGRFKTIKTAVMCFYRYRVTVTLPTEMVDCIFTIAFGGIARRVLAQP